MCTCTYQKWEVIYRVYKARRLCDVASKLSHSKELSTKAQGQQRAPGYLAERVDRGEELPDVMLEHYECFRRFRLGKKRGHLPGYVLEYVIINMKAELLEELKEFMWREE